MISLLSVQCARGACIREAGEEHGQSVHQARGEGLQAPRQRITHLRGGHQHHCLYLKATVS